MISKLFTSKHIVPAAYKLLLDSELGVGWCHWEPETVWAEIERIFKVVPTGEVRTKINAIKVFIATEVFYHDAPAFENIVLAVNDLFVDPTSFQICSPEEIVYALNVLRPIENTKQDFGREIVAYVDVSCKQAGLLKYPNELAFAQPVYEGMLAEIEKMIVPKFTDPTTVDLNNIVDVQGLRLFQINSYVTEKMAKFDIKIFEKSTA